jgi:hypothetical protein
MGNLKEIRMQGSGSGQNSPDVLQPARPVAPGTPVYRVVPRGGGQCTIDEGDNGSKTITCTSLPPDVYRLARGAERTAFGLMGLLAAIIILGPFARMLARRIERRADTAPSPDVVAMRRQMEQLQQSIDSMSIEVERISESQRFQSKLLYEGKEKVPAGGHSS